MTEQYSDLIDNLWELYSAREWDYYILGKDIFPYIEDEKELVKLQALYNKIEYAKTWDDKEQKTMMKILKCLDRLYPKIKNPKLKKRFEDMRYKMFQYWAAVEVLEGMN